MKAFYLLICLSFLCLISLYTMQRYKQWLSLKKGLNQIICIKKFHKETKSLISFVHRINQIIIAENIIQLASLFFPQTWVSQPSLAKAKKALKLAQEARVLYYYKELALMLKNQCRLSLRSLQTPFQLKGLSLKRNFQGVTMLRKKTTKLCHILSYQIICSELKFISSFNTRLEVSSSSTYLPRKL